MQKLIMSEKRLIHLLFLLSSILIQAFSTEGPKIIFTDENNSKEHAANMTYKIPVYMYIPLPKKSLSSKELKRFRRGQSMFRRLAEHPPKIGIGLTIPSQKIRRGQSMLVRLAEHPPKIGTSSVQLPKEY